MSDLSGSGTGGDGPSRAAEEPSLRADGGDGRYRSGTDATADSSGSPSPDEEEPKLGFFDRIPEWVVWLGAGSMFTSALLTIAGSIGSSYLLYSGQYSGFEPFQLLQASIMLSFSGVFQLSGVYYARRQMRWLWVMLAALAGILSVIALPFAILATICLGLGKNHFAAATPMEIIRGDDLKREDDDASDD